MVKTSLLRGEKESSILSGSFKGIEVYVVGTGESSGV